MLKASPRQSDPFAGVRQPIGGDIGQSSAPAQTPSARSLPASWSAMSRHRLRPGTMFSPATSPEASQTTSSAKRPDRSYS